VFHFIAWLIEATGRVFLIILAICFWFIVILFFIETVKKIIKEIRKYYLIRKLNRQFKE